MEGNELTPGVLNSIPSSLARWTLESLLLDGSSVHDLVNFVKPSIVTHLEKLQLQELREKVAEEKKKKEESEKEKEKAHQLPVSASNPNTRNRITNESSEPMDVSPTSALSTTTTQIPASFAYHSLFTPSDLIRNVAPSTSLISTQSVRSENLLSSVGLPTQLDTPSNYITPFNPLPDLTPNAPLRESLFSGLVPVTINSPNVNQMQHVSSQQTPYDAPRLNRLRENDGALTGDLGFTPLTRNSSNLQRDELPDISSVLGATPGESPSVRQVRSNLIFSQTPQTSVRASEEPNRTEEGTVLATELAAAIMLQLATTSPTPFSTANLRAANGNHAMFMYLTLYNLYN